MSNFLAVATVTAVLKRVLEAAASQAVAGAVVRMRRPEPPPGNGIAEPGIDLYLYQVVPNAALRNDDLPTRRADGTLLQRPRVALDLHYLLAFHGNDDQLEPQRILGNAVRALHAAPFVTESVINLVKTQDFPVLLGKTDLDRGFELVKVAPLPLSVEELSKLWLMFPQVPYHLSVAYQATVIVIEGVETPQQALPVLDRRLHVLPLPSAFIEEVASAKGRGVPILAGDTLVLKGRQLRRDLARVVVRGVPADPSVVSDTEIQIPLTSPPFPQDSLQAGVQGVSVVHPLLMGEPPTEHVGFQSNVAAFVLRPRIVAPVLAPASTQVTVTVDPAVAKGQRAVLLLNRVPGGPPSAHVFANAPASAAGTTIDFTIGGVPTGEYFVRVQVDGAESPVDLDPASPSFGPRVTVP